MPEIRYNTEVSYPEGLSAEERVTENAIITKTPYEVSDEELYIEQITQGSNDGIHDVRDKFDNWDSLNNTDKREVVKSLLTCMLNLYKGQY